MASRSIKNRPSIKKKHPSTGVLVVIFIMAAVLVVGGVGVYAVGSTWLQDLPDYESADAYNTALPTEIYASDGTTLLAEFQLENREPVTIDQISPYALKGTVATEDERFYEHGGVDMMGIIRAVVNNLAGGELEGASTITQQFIRNTVLSSEMNDISLKRKVREAYVSIKLEEQYSKNEILLMYMNTVNYGSGAYGIQAASQRYFSKDATQLTLAEAAVLVGIPQSPTYNNPINYPENSLARRNVVLDRMLTNGYITQEEHDAAQAEPLVLNPTELSSDGILQYPYFTSYVRNILIDPDGKYAYSRDEVFKGGLKVVTTLDVATQEAAEAAATKKAAQANATKEDDPYEVALVAVDPDNGHVKALVGGRDYYTSEVNMATGSGGTGRSPGSSFKTFTLVSALEAGISPSTMVDCSTRASFPGWQVANINYHDYGTRSLARAFAVSSNTGFARIILSIGPERVVETAHRMGIESELSAVGSLTLGTSPVSPLEMADAYATIANGGTHYDAECILSIEDRNGTVVVDNANPEGETALSSEIAYAATEIMKGVITTSEGTGKAARLESGQVAAGKTGTSEDYKDSWFCGITPQLSVAIWLGDRSDPAVAESVPTSVTAASAFSDFLDVALAGQPLEEFPEAEEPVYNTSYRSSEYHIGSGYYSSSSSTNNTEDDAVEEPADTTTPDDGNANNGTENSGGTTGGGTGSGESGSTGGTGTGTGGESGGTGTGGESGGTGTGGTGAGSGESGGTGTGGGESGGTGTGSGESGGTGTGSGESGGTGTGSGGVASQASLQTAQKAYISRIDWLTWLMRATWLNPFMA